MLTPLSRYRVITRGTLTPRYQESSKLFCLVWSDCSHLFSPLPLGEVLSEDRTDQEGLCIEPKGHFGCKCALGSVGLMIGKLWSTGQTDSQQDKSCRSHSFTWCLWLHPHCSCCRTELWDGACSLQAPKTYSLALCREQFWRYQLIFSTFPLYHICLACLLSPRFPSPRS